MGNAYPIEPVEVEPVNTKFRTIRSMIPHPDSVPLLESLRRTEPWCMEGQPPIVWDRAQDTTVYDAYGNRWIDFTSGVLITNAGHGRQPMLDAIAEQAHHGLLTSYCFPNRVRGELIELLHSVAPRDTDKVMLLSTGSETIEMCIKLSRQYGARSNKNKRIFVSFDNGFHGRTLGAQLAGGISSLKQWLGYRDEHFVQVPFPDGGIRSSTEDNDFRSFERHLEEAGVRPGQVCGVLTETYQGGNSSFAPAPYMQALRAWCEKHDVVLALDEVQAGFGRTGTFWGFEHYRIVPDLIACGKGISGSLPVSAVIGRHDLMDQFPPGSMTSTHSGNPICCAAAAANLKLILDGKLHERAHQLGPLLQDACAAIHRRFSDVIYAHDGRGLVASLHCVKSGGSEPDETLAFHVVERAVQQGVMLFAPVGYAGASVKIAPPLIIEEEALREGLEVTEAAFAQVLEAQVAAK